jgi:glycopeptide antibiotics resistance protein
MEFKEFTHYLKIKLYTNYLQKKIRPNFWAFQAFADTSFMVYRIPAVLMFFFIFVLKHFRSFE